LQIADDAACEVELYGVPNELIWAMHVDKIEILVSVFLVTSPWGEKKKKRPPPKFPNSKFGN
jgi:hypothetical protein